jgi:pimeloyl-ACP methyl ester carboxylesterase
VGGQAAPPGRELLVDGADGRPITVTDEGQGPAVLLLHPGSADRSSWARVAAALAGRFRVLRFTRWTYRDGHAAASPSGADAMAAEVRDVLAVAAAAGGRPLLAGHSSGAVVALESALAAPSAFRAMVLYEPPVAAQITDDEAIESLGVGVDRYANLRLPVLLLGGGRSPAHLRQRLDALAAVLPRLQEVVVLERHGHLANLTAPGEVAEVIAAFADRPGS